VKNGIFFRGEKATVFATDRTWILVPAGKENEKQVFTPVEEVKPGAAHMAEFLGAVRSRNQPSCTVEDAYRSTATVQLGMIAYRVGARIAWDAKREQLTGNAEAAKLLKREYRPPWIHPFRG
jgi:hypothetical protein